MTDLQSLLQGMSGVTNGLPSNSRYSNISTGVLQAADGTETVYLRRRLIPRAVPSVSPRWHSVREGDRLDNIAANYIGDPEKFWQIADINNAIKPELLTDEPGTRLRIS